MNYPVWYLPETGGGLLIALIAILHVFVSHFAVGGGLYLIFSEKKGLRENSASILEFTRKHARFFLLVTMVFGSITGVGIWFIIALVNPAATSILIHNFVFGWATEWIFFVVEIAAAFVYFYMFDRMAPSTHLKVGWLYFIAAWLSLFVINGIICLMLTPGGWVESLDFWEGFFNPSFWPSLAFRTFIAVMIAACYGYFSASFTKEKEVKVAMTRFSAKWALVGLLGSLPCGLWYLSVLPDSAHSLVMGKSPTIVGMLPWGVWGAVILLAVVLGCGLYRPANNIKPVAVLALLSSLAVMGSFEWIREAARRPYVINEMIYSNSILKKDVDRLTNEGFLQNALWIPHKEIREDNQVQVGRELFIHQCYACHTIGGANNDIVGLTENMSYRAMTRYLGKIHQIRYFMPPFAGNEEEQNALAAFLVGELHGKEIAEEPMAGAGPEAPGLLLFEENCASCHAPEDLSDTFVGVVKAEILQSLATLNEISDEMEPFEGTEQEQDQLASYLALQGSPAEDQKLPMSETGGLLFEDNCSVCHAVDEVTGAFAGLSNEEGVQMLKNLDEISEEMAPFGGTDGQAELLVDYLINEKGEE